jgi:hypothetical protein
MRKLLGVTVATAALSAFAVGGTASAATCPPNEEAGAATTQPISVSGTTVAGNLPGVGYGQATVDTTSLSYTGTLNGDGVGYGDVYADATHTGGTPGGSADGGIDGVIASSGSLSGTSLGVQTTPGVGCVGT